ncbi:hypothetical protein TWF694_001883 [Orbilia ellipsospora]|uniref:Uncharacterized protein n=1 Tax=Orbilia ellipsospora TaxID=2528407 RepID=A0AAV9X5A6_9PEZI
MLFGRRLSPVRLIIYTFLIGVTVTFFSSLSSIPVPESAAASLEKIQNKGKEIFGPHLEGWVGPGAHRAPEPTNGTASTSSWYEHWSWLNPFASSQDYSENRTILPPLPKRCPIYAYYDQDIKSSVQTHTDDAVMLAWRRAWWAAGFEPIILNPTDAKRHGLYNKVKLQLGKDNDKLEYNILRWLAWDRMGSGLLSDFRIFPMPVPSDPVLPFLRRCEFGMSITRFQTLGSGLFAGSSPIIKSVVTNITSSDLAKVGNNVTSPADMATDLFTVDDKPKSIAYYARNTVAEKYRNLPAGNLPRLINAHLHAHFLSLYPKGISILNPIHPNSDVLTHESYELAQKLVVCPESPFPVSCPPHVEDGRCQLCDGKTKIQLTKDYKNTTDVFTLGYAPHPLTLQAFVSGAVVRDLKSIRRNSTRDMFLKSVTNEIAEKGTGAGYRGVKMKEVVAASLSSTLDRKPVTGFTDSIWATVEKGWDAKGVEWVLGFTLPDKISPLPVMNQEKGVVDLHTRILSDSRVAVLAGTTGLKRFRAAIEGWSLRDFEFWRFVKAFEERRATEREEWLKREKGFGKGLER